MDLLLDEGAQEFLARRVKVREALGTAGLNGLLAYSPAWRKEDVRFLSHCHLLGNYSLVLMNLAGEAILFVSDPFDGERAAKGWIREVRSIRNNFSAPAQAIGEMGIKVRLGLSGFSFAPCSMISAVRTGLPDLELVGTEVLAQIRLKKSPWELARIRKAAEIADQGYDAFQRLAGQGVREFELVAEVEYVLKRLRAEDNFMLIASGKDLRSMRPPTSRNLRPGETVITELTPKYDGYWAQVCRTLVIGPPSSEQTRAFDIFWRAQEAAFKIARPGLTASDLARAQNDVFRAQGFGQYTGSEYTRGRGHGHGLHFDEDPMLVEGNQLTLEPGMVIVIHPNTYLPLAGYMVQGDTVVITETGCEVLTSTERKLFQAS